MCRLRCFGWLVAALLTIVAQGVHPALAADAPRPKTASAFFPQRLVEQARANAKAYPWAAQPWQAIVAAAEPWLRLSDDALWDLMFSNGIKRSWMVWSNGHCPACKKPVPMYEWIPDAMRRPWKMQCPRCGELFPKNDFARFYRSGLDEQGVFVPAKADRSLLFNTEHPNAADPLHRFGVDDGEGYVEGKNRWRFIGAYLIYGQWKQAIVGGISRLADAYLLTGDSRYAHKAGVLLDRVADLYPTFDFGREGVMYEGPPHAGYVSTWHDACVEVRQLAMAYDAVFEALAADPSLAPFLAAKARRHRLANAKSTLAEIRRNIEERILRDTLAHRAKIESNYPSTDATLATLTAVLGWPGNRGEVTAMLDRIIEKSTAVDGVTGEKGLDGYGAIAPRTVAEILGWYARADADFLKDAVKRNPRLAALYRFHIDTWCVGQYYPRCGDTGAFAQRNPNYAGVGLTQAAGIAPSDYAFLYRLFEATGDADFVRIMYAANGNTTKNLPYDLFAADPAEVQRRVAETIAAKGAAIELPSVNKQQWGLAILRSGREASARAVWLDYDSGGGHGHADAMNLGLFAKGLDLLPDFGYPPVQYGGWGAPRSVWYTQSAAHNTVLVDGQNSRPGLGKTTLWADGRRIRVVRAAGEQLVGAQQFERTVAMIDLSDDDCYVLDVFRVAGGREHAKFTSSHFGRITPIGLSLADAENPGLSGQLRAFRKAASPPPVWAVDWTVEDRWKYLPPGSDIHLRYTDLTPGTEVFTAEAWVSPGMYGGTDQAWVPRVIVRRRSPQGPLASTFVGVIEPYQKNPNIAAVRRLPLETADGKPCAESHVAFEIRLADGRRDVLIALDPASALGPVVQKETGMRLDGQFGWVRFDAAGKPQHAAVCRGKSLESPGLVVRPDTADGWKESL